MMKEVRNFRVIYSPETQALIDKWSKELSDYDKYFIEKNSQFTQQYIKEALNSDTNRKMINDVLLSIHQTAIPVAINYG